MATSQLVSAARTASWLNTQGLFNEATKLAGAAGTKGTVDVAVADKLIAKIDEIAEIFWATKK